MSTITSLMRKAAMAVTISTKEAKKATKAAEALAKVEAKVAEVLADKAKFVRIIRSQLALCRFPFVTFNDINDRAQEGDIDACEFMMEFVAQERADLEKAELGEDFVSDDEITQLWANGVVLSRIAAMDPKPVHAWYQAEHKRLLDATATNEHKLFVRVAHIARALTASETLELKPVNEFLNAVLEYYSTTFKVESFSAYDPDWDLERG